MERWQCAWLLCPGVLDAAAVVTEGGKGLWSLLTGRGATKPRGLLLGGITTQGLVLLVCRGLWLPVLIVVEERDDPRSVSTREGIHQIGQVRQHPFTISTKVTRENYPNWQIPLPLAMGTLALLPGGWAGRILSLSTRIWGAWLPGAGGGGGRGGTE